MTLVLVTTAALYGLVIGSFLNVVIYRVPNGQSVVRPPSACPGCATPIRVRDNIPVLSWVWLRGRCRGCATRIPVRYPLVETLTAIVFVALALRFGATWSLPAETVFGAGTIALAFIDLDHMLLPRTVIYPLGAAVAALLAVAAGTGHQWHRLAVAAACGLVEFALLLTIRLASPRSLGFGDVRFGPVIGLAVGWLGWRCAFLAFLTANLLGTLVGLGLIAFRGAGLRTRIPFGVFLAAGALLAVLFGDAVHFPG